MKSQIKILISTLILLCAGATQSLAQVDVTATIDQTRIPLNESFVLSVEISGRDAGEPQLPPMDNFAALVGTSSSQSFQFVNGRMSASKTIHYTFVAREVGKFEIGAVTVESNGQIYRSQPIQIEIIKASGSSQQQPGAQRSGRPQQSQRSAPVASGNEIFLKTEINKRSVYQGEPIIVSYKIYTLRNITSYGVSQLPSFSGFWVENFPLPRQPRTSYEVINGQRYLVAEIKRTALFPQTSGKHTLDPMTLECEVRAQRQRRSRDIFDSFFDDPFFSRTERRAVVSKPVMIEVLPLPIAGKPSSFSGAVGKYSLRATVDRREVKANEAITLKVIAAGVGNIKTLPAPKVDLPAVFEVYDPKVSEKIEHDDNKITGSKTWEYVIVPRYPGTQKIEPITLAYFDPSIKQYRLTSTNEISIDVAKGNTDFAAATGAVSKEDVRLLGQDIRFISLAAPTFQKIGATNYTSTWFLALLALPIFGFIGALFYQRHQEKLSTNVAYARSRKATKLAHKQLQKAKKLLNANDSKGFYAEVQHAMTGFLGNKLNVAEGGLITDRIETLLKEQNVSSETITKYLDCLHTCDFQRFSPADTNGQAMKVFYDKARHAIEELEDAL